MPDATPPPAHVEEQAAADVSHHHAAEPPLGRHVARYLWVAIAVCAVATAIAAVALWPFGEHDSSDPLVLDADPAQADIVADEPVPCSYDATDACRQVGFVVRDGPFAGEVGTLELSVGSMSVGDTILVTAFETDTGEVVFSFYDFERSSPMLLLAVVFVGAVLLLGRWRGVGALAGLAFSLLVLVVFTLPAILDGTNALAVALVTASLIACAALFLAHGFEISTAVALLSTFASLLITAVLAWAFVGATHLTGVSDDSSTMLAALAGGIDARGILLAGIVIGSLGVLDDVTVTQVSAVWQLKSVRPELNARQLFVPALRIGRDHIASTVNTLFLAYAGAALPLLLLFTEARQSFGSVITRELVAVEVVRALVGSIGLIASVPIATGLAALVATSDDV